MKLLNNTQYIIDLFILFMFEYYFKSFILILIILVKLTNCSIFLISIQNAVLFLSPTYFAKILNFKEYLKVIILRLISLFQPAHKTTRDTLLNLNQYQKSHFLIGFWFNANLGSNYSGHTLACMSSANSFADFIGMKSIFATFYLSCMFPRYGSAVGICFYFN